MKKVISVTPLEDKKLSVEFSDGVSGIFNVRPYIKSDFFKRLEDDDYFRQVRLFFTGIGWPEGQGLGLNTIAADLQPFAIVAENMEAYKRAKMDNVQLAPRPA